MKDVKIRLKESTREALKDLGKKGETYDDVILKLIDEHKKGGEIDGR